MIKYTVDGSGIVELIHNEMSVQEIVNKIVAQNYIMELFEGDMEAAKEQIFMVASDTQAEFEYIDKYFRTLHKKSQLNT